MSTYQPKDRFYQKAKKEGYPARSAYKLIEMDQKFKILKPGFKIVDVGCAPGGWLKVIEEKTNLSFDSDIHLVGIDLLSLQFTPCKNTIFLQGNFLEEANQTKIKEILKGDADLILSDISPNLSGIKFKDLNASLELVEAVFHFAKNLLRKGGNLIVKVFPGPESATLQKEFKKTFQQVITFLPEATRKTSNEVYWVGKGFKG